MSRRQSLAVWWVGLIGLWMILSADLSWPDLIIGGVAASVVLGFPALSTIPRLEGWRPRRGVLSAWMVGDWRVLMATLVRGVHRDPVGHVRWLRGDGDGPPGPYLASVGPGCVVIGVGSDGDLLAHVLEPGDGS